jgi:sporulation protein YlmC with PRC-barrel domain
MYNEIRLESRRHRVKRSRIVTRVKELSEEPGVNKPISAEKPAGEIKRTTIEEIVAISCEELKVQNVFNGKGERLGKIEDLVIDLNSGRIAYAVLSFGGFLGFGNKQFAIPWDLLCIDNRWNYQDIYRQKIVFNVSREKLEKSPGFNRNELPRESDKEWLKDIHEYYGCKPYWALPEETGKPEPPGG